MRIFKHKSKKMKKNNTKTTETVEKTGDLVWVLTVFFALAMISSLIWGEIVDFLVKNNPNKQQNEENSQLNSIYAEKVWRIKEIKRKDGTIDWIPAQKQTVEMRSPDGSADVYELIAGLVVACRYGFEFGNALEIAERTYVNVNIHQKENAAKLKGLAQLPDSCAASADALERQRALYEARGVFSPAMIDGILKNLRAFDDRTLREDIGNDREQMLELVHKYFHCG